MSEIAAHGRRVTGTQKIRIGDPAFRVLLSASAGPKTAKGAPLETSAAQRALFGLMRSRALPTPITPARNPP